MNFTPSVITEIKRQDKQVIMSDGTFLPYDILVLLVGEQYQAPTLTKGGYSDIPSNVFIVNTDTDATYALKKLAEIMVKDINPEGEKIRILSLLRVEFESVFYQLVEVKI